MPPRPAVPAATRRLQLAMLAVLAALLGAGMLAGRLHHQRAGTSSPSSTIQRLTIRGSITAAVSPGCTNGPGQVTAGAPVRLLDSTGAVLATTTLGTGVEQGGGCVWSYRASVPATASYQVQVGGLPPASVTRDQLARSGGVFQETDTPTSPALHNIQSGA